MKSVRDAKGRFSRAARSGKGTFTVLQEDGKPAFVTNDWSFAFELWTDGARVLGLDPPPRKRRRRV